MNAAPYEVIGAPYTIWVAPVGTAFPSLDDAEEDFDPAWTKVGTSGDLSYTEKGVTFEAKQKINYFTPAGSTIPRKAFRTEEGSSFQVEIADLTLEQMSIVLNSNTVTHTPAGTGTRGTKEIDLTRGLDVATMAMLARGYSPYGPADKSPVTVEEWPAQYEMKRVVADGEPKVAYTKGKEAGLDLQFMALADDDGKIGRLIATSEAAGT